MLPPSRRASSSPWSTTAPSPSGPPFSPTSATRPSSAAAHPPHPHPPLLPRPPIPLVRPHLGPHRLLPLQRQLLLRHRLLWRPPRVRRPQRRRPRHPDAVLPPPRRHRPLLLRRQPRRQLQRPHDGDTPRGEGSLPGGGVLANLLATCPHGLQVSGPTHGAVVGCKSGCVAHGTDELCYRNHYNSLAHVSGDQLLGVLQACLPNNLHLRAQ
ncbi:osmotin-like protein [Phtheirospermum japonicum]|uniref:Osmotin-like protein n=1 Tax=Phtheirospermum japonicum TaxID=374723 RepID=A0A830B8Y9_9LAMI|nr:osmotin-like protein [Phtheirospermum japonicum]